MSVRLKRLGRKQEIEIVIALLLSLLCGCGDPGYHLRPVGWQSISDREWKKEYGDFEIHTRGIGGLIGEWWVDPDLQIHNSTKSISLEGASLLTATETFSAEVHGSEPIPPSKNGYHFPVEWKFNNKRVAPKVLGDHCAIVLNLKIDGERREIKIEYEKY